MTSTVSHELLRAGVKVSLEPAKLFIVPKTPIEDQAENGDEMIHDITKDLNKALLDPQLQSQITRVSQAECSEVIKKLNIC